MRQVEPETYRGSMRRLLDPPTTSTATISVRAAKTFVTQLRAGGDDFSSELADLLQGRLTVAELSGAKTVDLDPALVEVLAIEDSIDALVHLVIDLR